MFTEIDADGLMSMSSDSEEDENSPDPPAELTRNHEDLRNDDTQAEANEDEVVLSDGRSDTMTL